MLSRYICLFFNLSNRSLLTFTDPSEEDLGLYTVEMSDNPNLSSSYDFTAEGKVKQSRRSGNCLVSESLVNDKSTVQLSCLLFSEKANGSRNSRTFFLF